MAPVYFISLQILQNFIVQSLFILVILQSLENDEEDPTQSFKKMLKDFRKHWHNFTKDTTNKKIHSKNLISFFKSLPKPLGSYKFELIK